MKVLLINPPNKYMLTANTPSFVDTEGGYNPPLGLLYVAGYLQEHSRHEVEIIDALVAEMDYSQLKEVIQQRQPEVVGITTLTFTLMDVLKTVSLVKETLPGTKIVLGGPHVHIYPKETIALPGVDYLVLGEGERIFKDLLDNIGSPQRLKKIKGLVFKDNGEIIFSGTPDFIADLDELPFPPRELTPYQKYYSLMAKGAPITTMITSRGCPYRCIFCNRPHMGKKFRARSAQSVVAEMEYCVDLGINDFLVYDDTFTIVRQRVLDICDEIKRKGLNIGWDIRARVNTVDEEMLAKLRASGCERIYYGIEAGTDRVLKILRKGITIDQARRAFKWTRKTGISILAYFMIGAPTETKEEMLETIRISQELAPDYVHFSILTPFPGTEVYQQGLASGLIKNDYWQEFARHPSIDFSPPFLDGALKNEELLQLLKDAYQGFYLRSGYVIKRLLRIRSYQELRRKVKAGLKVLTMD